MDQPLNFFDLVLAALMANTAFIAIIFAAMRLRKRDKFDVQSLIAVGLFSVITFSAGYFAS